MTFPVRPVIEPAVLRGQPNGELPRSILMATPGQAGGPVVFLVAPAARAWRALAAAALDAGHVLKLSGTASGYRTLAQQVVLFEQRFTTTPNGSRTTRRWNGRTWYLRPGMALAAVPGTSNHGRGLAVDTGEERDGDTGTESIDADTVKWLVKNEERFGWSHEVQSEPWHLRYWAGDQIPAAVLEYEESLQPVPRPPAANTQEPQMFFACEKGGAVWFFEPGRRTLTGNPDDRAEIAKAAGISTDYAELSKEMFARLIAGRATHQ